MPDVVYDIDLIDRLLEIGVDPPIADVLLADVVTGGLAESDVSTRHLKVGQPAHEWVDGDARRLVPLRLLRFTPAGLEVYNRLSNRASTPQ